jgi:hypothetical protein
MALDFQLVIDCAEPHTLADWWADALGWEVEKGDEIFIRRMVDEGHATEDEVTTHDGRLVWKVATAILHPDGREGGRPRILFQQVPEPKTVKNRIHIDLRPISDEAEKQIADLVDKGATLLWRGQEGPVHTWAVLADPEGNEFCVPTR